MSPQRVARFDEAVDAGMTPAQAGRWVAYCDRKAAAGETPIALWNAVAQLRAAARTPRTVVEQVHAAAVGDDQ